MAIAWFATAIPKSDRNRIAEKAAKIIRDYDQFAMTAPGITVIRDEGSLPHDKDKIIMAFCHRIATEDNMAASAIRSLAGSALSLAYFQKDVGDDLHPSGVDITQFDLTTMSEEALLDFFREDGPIGKEKYDRMLPAVQADLDRIERMLKAAISLRARIRK
jgi:hypothetical protein